MKERKKCGCMSDEDQASLVTRSMKDYGFYIHYIPNGKPINYHTHGLIESCNHIDLQIAFNMPPDVAIDIMHTMVGRLKKGERFKDGDIVAEVLGNGYKVKLWQTVECGRPVLRLLLPDRDGLYPDDPKCTKGFRSQLQVDKF